ncbi:hypothetical protein [Streptomyces sp. NRRL F-5126]|uniref:hypothetical protein n=1 Tax=Streptomyces sp. NRRL F-5126 TaxID=1463857 RepID=UPI0004CABA94|nr:hypothetical protein [Streptomyces sp. NRRL F-5126]
MSVTLPHRRSSRLVACAALCAALAGAVAGCGDPDAGTNGVGKLSARGIERKARTAVDGATAVRVSGKLVTSGQTYTLDMRLTENGATGSVASHKTTFTLLRVGDALYLKGSDAFWHQAADGTSPAVADKLGGKYVKVPADDPSYKRLRGFTDMRALLDGLLALGGTPAKGDRKTLDGVKTIEVTGGDDGKGGTLDVSLRGKPYPLRLVRAGGAGTVTLKDWGKAVALKPPSKDQLVDYGSKIPHT